MKKWFPVLFCCFVSTAPLFAATYFVSVDGKDSSPGTEARPFRTIQKAADIMVPGDTCIIRGGTYRETVRPARSGQAGKPIRFVAARNETVVLDGTEPITGKWSQHSGNIYKTGAADAGEQLFVDRKMMIEARWPNMRFDQIFDRSAWAKTGKGSRYGKIVDPKLTATNIDWTGAVAMLNVAHQFFSWTRTIQKHAAGSNTFTYPKNLTGITRYATETKPWEDDYYYLFGKLEALDAPTEWFYDRGDGLLYLYTDDGKSPAGRRVEYKKRKYGFDVKGLHNIEIDGLHFFACTFLFDNCDDCVVDHCSLLFPTYSRRITEFDDPSKPSPVTSVNGQRNTVRNTDITYASGTGLEVVGTSNLVENCIIRDVCWSGTLKYPALVLYGDEAGSKSIVRRNTLYNAGNAILKFNNGSHIIEYNHVFQGGLLCRDVSLIYTQQPECRGSIVRYNWAHGCRTEGFIGQGHGGMGIRGDDQTRGLTVHHNVVWDCGIHGIIVKGDHNRVFNNTIFDIGPKSPEAQKKQPGRNLLIPTRAEPKKPWRKQFPLLKAQNTNSLFYNNAVGNIVWRGKPLPVGDKFTNNLELAGKPPEAWLADPKNMDFRPRKDSPLIDAGREIPGFTDNYHGKAPDIGAYEYGGKQWKPGSDLLDK